METILESFYEGLGVFIFCLALALLFYCFFCTGKQTDAVKKNIYDQHMLYGAEIN